jgi:hypothetical protein
MPKKSHTITGNKRFMTKRAIPILKKYGIKNVKAAERGGFFLELTFDIDDAKLQKLDKELKKANKSAYGGVLEQIRKIIREEIQKLTEAAISFDEMFDAYGFSLSDSDEGVKFYLHSKAKLDGFAEGNKLASVGRMSGKDNKVFRNPIKLGFWLEKKFKLKNKYLEENKRLKLNEENESLWTWVYKGFLDGFRKAEKKGKKDGIALSLDEVAHAAAFLVKTEFGSGAKSDFIKTFKRWL